VPTRRERPASHHEAPLKPQWYCGIQPALPRRLNLRPIEIPWTESTNTTNHRSPRAVRGSAFRLKIHAAWGVLQSAPTMLARLRRPSPRGRRRHAARAERPDHRQKPLVSEAALGDGRLPGRSRRAIGKATRAPSAATPPMTAAETLACLSHAVVAGESLTEWAPDSRDGQFARPWPQG